MDEFQPEVLNTEEDVVIESRSQIDAPLETPSDPFGVLVPTNQPTRLSSSSETFTFSLSCCGALKGVLNAFPGQLEAC